MGFELRFQGFSSIKKRGHLDLCYLSENLKPGARAIPRGNINVQKL